MHDYSIMLELISKLEANTADILNQYSIRKKATTQPNRDNHDSVYLDPKSPDNFLNKTDFEILNDRAKLFIFKSESNRVSQKTGLMQIRDGLNLSDIKLANENYFILLGGLIHRRLRIKMELTTKKSYLYDAISQTLAIDSDDCLDPYTIYKSLVVFRNYMESDITFEGKQCKRYTTLIHYKNSNFVDYMNLLLKQAAEKAKPYTQAWNMVFFIQSLARNIDELKNYSANAIITWITYLKNSDINWEKIKKDDLYRYLETYLSEIEKLTPHREDLNYLKDKLKIICSSGSSAYISEGLTAERLQESLLRTNSDYYCFVFSGASLLLQHCLNTHAKGNELTKKNKSLMNRLFSKSNSVQEIIRISNEAHNVMKKINDTLGIELPSNVNDYIEEHMDCMIIFKKFITVEYELIPRKILSKTPEINLDFFKDLELNFKNYINQTYDYFKNRFENKNEHNLEKMSIV